MSRSTEEHPSARSPWRAVAIPDEHGGWALTAEPALLGIVVAPSWAGAALIVAAFVAFLVRTPLKVVLVDRWRDRRLPRTRLAARLAAIELVVLVGLAVLALVLSGGEWLIPVAVAAPLVGIELWFDMRSRSRRLVPELCGAVGMSAVAASVALAGGADGRLAVALWLVLAGRSVASIPFARAQIARLRRGAAPPTHVDLAQTVGIVIAGVAIACDPDVVLGAIAVVVLALTQGWWARRPPVPAKVVGLRQLFCGLAIVAVTAAGVLA